MTITSPPRAHRLPPTHLQYRGEGVDLERIKHRRRRPRQQPRQRPHQKCSACEQERKRKQLSELLWPRRMQYHFNTQSAKLRKNFVNNHLIYGILEELRVLAK
jgi:hypothetical protein